MSIKAIVLVKGGQEYIYPLKAEKTLLGRDKSCDIVLDDVAVSRKHAAIIFRFEKIYIENISPSGQIFKGGQATEYAELEEGVEINLGPYVLVWRHVEDSAFQEVGKVQNNADASAISSGAATPEVTMASVSPMNPQLVDAPLNPEAQLGALQAFNPNQAANAFSVEDASSAGFDSQDFAAISASEATQVSQQQALPKLRIVKGEEDGREIKLDIGSVWVVGRSRKAHIHIESTKISRQHFKIIKMNNRYRLQDMGSSSGTKLNGVTVADAPLQPFDTIQAGSVELQFILVDSAFQNIEVPRLAGAALLQTPHRAQGAASSSFEGHNSTIVNMPVPYDPNRAQEDFGKAGAFASGSVSEEEWDEEVQAESDDPSIKKLPPWLLKIKRKQRELKKQWLALPPKKRYLYSGTGAVFILMILLSVGGDPTADTGATVSARKPASGEENSINIAQSPDISPTYYALSIDKQNMIRKLYVDAERAESKGQWQEALDSSSKILELVDKYKRTKDIMLQAQAQINESYFKNSNSVGDAQDAAAKNKDQAQVLMDSGTVALSQKRWADAEEAFVSVLTLDPNNKEAQHGLIAARNKDPMAQYEGPQTEFIEIDPELEIKQREIETVQSLRTQYQIAADYVRGPDFRNAIPILKDLDTKLNNLLGEYRGGRGPASIRDELSMNTGKIQSMVEEAYDQALSQLDIEYQTQLADADQYIANRQYVQARQHYDQILEREPLYDKVRVARARLYDKIITEAKNIYRGAVIYESVGDLRAAVAGLQKTKDLLENVRDYQAVEYLLKAEARLAYLKR